MADWYKKYAVMALLAALWTFGYYSVDWTKIDSSQWAAWVQAIGSVLAILVAVGVAWHQSESQRRREQEREINDGNALLRCLRADMSSHLEQVHTGFAPIINATGPGQPVLSMFPVPEDPFSMYNAFLPKLGIIQDDTLRIQIVRSYAAAKSFVLTVRCNNELLAERKRTAEAHNPMAPTFTQFPMDEAKSASDRYGDMVRESYLRVMQEVAILKPMLEHI